MALCPSVDLPHSCTYFALFLHFACLAFADEFLDFGFPPPHSSHPGISRFQPTDPFTTCDLRPATCNLQLDLVFLVRRCLCDGFVRANRSVTVIVASIVTRFLFSLFFFF